MNYLWLGLKIVGIVGGGLFVVGLLWGAGAFLYLKASGYSVSNMEKEQADPK